MPSGCGRCGSGRVVGKAGGASPGIADRGREVRLRRTHLPPNGACGSPALGYAVSGRPLQALDNKIQLIKSETSQAMVRFTAQPAGELIDHCRGKRRPLLKGYRMRILDGTHLGKTKHRLQVLQNARRAPCRNNPCSCSIPSGC
jgi:hypothetical protein